MKKVPTTFEMIFLLVSLYGAPGLNAQVLPALTFREIPNDEAPVKLYEAMYLHIDRVKYIAGEDVWFSIYNTDRETGKLSATSKIGYVELLNPWNVPVIRARIKLSGGKGEGNFLLPDSISSGTYTLRAYTNRMKSFLPDYCFACEIEVYNPFKSSYFWRKTRSSDTAGIRLVSLKDEAEDHLILSIDSAYNRREKVSLRIDGSHSNGDKASISELSISVAPEEISAGCFKKTDHVILRSDPESYAFENEGHYLSVRVRYRKSNDPDSSGFLYMSIQGKLAEFNYAAMDTTGRFTFLLPVDSKLRNLILQPEHATDNMVLEVEPSFSWIMPSSYSVKDSCTGAELELFSEMSFNYQAARIYGTRSKKDGAPDDYGNLKKRRFYGIPEMEIFLDDYIRLPSMQEVFFELLPGINLRARKSGYDIKITNPLTGEFYEEPPLVMIDGVIINDLTVLADLNPELVEKIEVVKTPYLIGDLILHGIVNVITRSGDFSSITMPDYAVILPYRVIEIPSSFISPSYSDKQSRLSRKPDLRNTLYWNPSVKTTGTGVAEVEFWTSDLPGNYTVSVRGISDSGEIICSDKSFRVR